MHAAVKPLVVRQRTPSVFAPARFSAASLGGRGSLRDTGNLRLIPQRCAVHHLAHLLYEPGGYIVVKHVAHRVNEDAPRCLPGGRTFQHIFMEGQLESIRIARLAHRLKSLGHPLGIAEVAARTVLGTARHRVPGKLRPLDGGWGPQTAPMALVAVSLYRIGFVGLRGANPTYGYQQARRCILQDRPPRSRQRSPLSPPVRLRHNREPFQQQLARPIPLGIHRRRC